MRKIYTVDVLLRNDLHGLYEHISGKDKLHVNDIEEIGEEFARHHAELGLNGKDLIVNAKRMNLVFILDPDTMNVRWYSHAPWNQPHDIDLHGHGVFTLFDNNQAKGKPERRWGTSRILSIDPRNAKPTTLFQEDWFHSDTRADHQFLGDNLLVTSDNQGLVFNVYQGEVNFWYSRPYNGEKGWFIEDAQWVPSDFFEHPELSRVCQEA